MGLSQKQNIIENRSWRYATKKFDSTKKVSDEDFELLLEALRLSASSYGLQPYKIFVITAIEVRKKLRPFSWDQSQVTDASHFIVIANLTDFNNELIDNYIANVANTRNIPKASLQQYGDFMKSKLVNLPTETKKVWAAKQAYIALSNIMQAAAELKIDTCPMEGIDTEKYDEILGLKKLNLTATIALPIGYRSEEDETQHYAKVRKAKEELFTLI